MPIAKEKGFERRQGELMDEGEVLQSKGEATAESEAVRRAFGEENRRKLIDRYFAEDRSKSVTADNAWQHVYRLLLWSDPTTGLAHCYESDKSQPGKPWYTRSLAFHDWLCSQLGVQPAALANEVDWLFVEACTDLAAAVLRRESRLIEIASDQRRLYEGRGFPEPGSDPELVAIIEETLKPYLTTEPSAEEWRVVAQRVRQFLAVQNNRKNLVGEGFEDVLAHVVRRACGMQPESIRTRSLLYEIPGFNRARRGGKENKVDLAILRPPRRTLVTAKWSVRADREKQFPTEYDEYINAESEGQKFHYVFVTNEFDPARLMRACDALFRNSFMFDHVVHINTDAIRATYGDLSGKPKQSERSRRRVIEHIASGRLISLAQWVNTLS